MAGAVLPGVTVEASGEALIEKVRSAVTDGTGQYRIVDLRPGTYLVVGNFSGYDTTMHMNGPWGDVTAYTAATTDIGTVIALTVPL